MDPITLQTVSGMAQAVIALAALIASIAIPFVMYQGQRRRETVEFIRSVREMLTVDATALENPELLDIADQSLAPESRTRSQAERKKSWLGLMVLNIVYMDFRGAKQGFHAEAALQTLEMALRTMLRDDEMYQLTQSPAANDKAFREFCRGIRDAIVKEAAASQRTSSELPATV